MRWEFRAGDEPASSRREYWQHVACQALGAIELRAVGDVDRSDRIVAGGVGAVRVGELSALGPGGAARTETHARRTPTDLCKIDLPMDGGGVVEQDGRRAVLRAGDFALTDLSRPARWTMDARRVIAVVFPIGMLPLRPDQIRRMSAVAIPGDRGGGALASALTARLAGHLDEYGPAEAARAGSAVVDLIGSALADRVDGDLPHRTLASRVTAYIEAHLAEPDLSVAAVAAANHLSVRALHRLFEERDGTVAAWIRRRRLERCRRDLADPSYAGRPVSAIGARWGMTNPSHFSRAFRSAYGITPAEFRRRG
jgi:AraC-like DNA-binding protein